MKPTALWDVFTSLGAGKNFRALEQYDASEYLSVLLNGLHQELNTGQLYHMPNIGSDNKLEEQFAAECWTQFIAADNRYSG